MSRFAVTRRPLSTLNAFETRQSSWLARSPYIVPGAIRLIVALAAPPESGRPSDGWICAFRAV